MSQSAGTLFTRLVPILRVADLDAERRFYTALGLQVTYEGPEYPDFLAIGTDDIEFGIERGDDFRPEQAPSVVTWQLGVADVDAAADACRAAGLDAELAVHTPAPDWTYRTLHLRSPNGYRVLLEGPRE